MSTDMTSPEDRLASLREQLAALQRANRRSARKNTLITVLSIALIAAAGVGASVYAKSVLSPEAVVSESSRLLQNASPRFRRLLLAEVERNAPQWAELLSTRFIDSAPALRESLEDYLLDRTSDVIDELTFLSEDEFRRLLDKQRPAVEQAIVKLQENPQYADLALPSLQRAVERELRSDMQSQSAEVLRTTRLLHERLNRLAAAEDLSEEEEVERHTLMLIRSLQVSAGEEGRMKDEG